MRARAEQLREQQARAVLIAVSFCIGVLSSTISAWLWWKFGGWVAQHLGMAHRRSSRQGILLFLLLPAIVIAGLPAGISYIPY